MSREPDWESLGQLQFLLMRRLIEPLNSGLAAISLVHLPTAAGKPRAYWQARATSEVLGVLNLLNAWQALIRYKLGELLPRQHIRPFPVQDLLDWLSGQLELVTPLHAEENLTLESNREALQEALLLLYSAAFTLGPNVHLVVQSLANGMWFRVRFGHTGDRPGPRSLEEILARLQGNWRLEDTALELKLAADFVTLSGSRLHVQSTEQMTELAFFVYAQGQRPPDPARETQVSEPPPITIQDTEELLIAYSRSAGGADEHTQPLPESEIERLVDDTVLMVLGPDFGEKPAPPAPQTPPTDEPDSTDTPART
ncbi:MAG: hypothetical protein HPY64_03925 [Anaerolineae bacterium]|nr:hypothetical protein [Anaerolineae bacterium]